MVRQGLQFEPANRLLSLLPKNLQERMIRSCEPVHHNLRDVLYEPNETMLYAYFPINGVVSMVATMDDGASVEVATTGNEGMLGLPIFLGTDQTPLRAFSQIPGDCLRLSTPEFKKYVKEEPALVAVLHRFAQALMMQISQGTACNRAHAIEQRCCRWLLMTQDRVNKPTFELTQEFLAQMLGVRRASVGEIAAALQEAKLIQYTRGVIKVVNRRGLEKRACSCYYIIRDEYERLLNNHTPQLLDAATKGTKSVRQ